MFRPGCFSPARFRTDWSMADDNRTDVITGARKFFSDGADQQGGRAAGPGRPTGSVGSSGVDSIFSGAPKPGARPAPQPSSPPHQQRQQPPPQQQDARPSGRFRTQDAPDSSISSTSSTSSTTARTVQRSLGDDKLEGVVLSDDFLITKMVGFGGYGRVYQAEQLSVGKRAVAIKVLHSMHRDRPATVAAFKREVGYLSMLRAPCFPRVIRTGLTPDQLPYFAMEFVSGKALDSILKNQGALDINRATYVMDRVCEGIVEMHRKDIVHRDIKPGNVIIEEGPAKTWSVWMLDLGCAKPAYEPDAPKKQTETFSFGSPPYMAPETVISGITNEQTDIYSLGAMAYEIFTGIRAVHLKDTTADSYFAYLRNVEKPLPTYRVGTIVPELPEVIEQVIHRALSRDLSVRYTSAMDFRNALVSAAGPYLDRLSSMSINMNTSANVSGFARKDTADPAKKSPRPRGFLLRFKKG